jgi:hypothetical protein
MRKALDAHAHTQPRARPHTHQLAPRHTGGRRLRRAILSLSPPYRPHLGRVGVCPFSVGSLLAGPTCRVCPGASGYILGCMRRISLPLPSEMLERIDKVRGDVPRTVWIRRSVERALSETRVEFEAVRNPGGSVGLRVPAEQPDVLAWKPGREMVALVQAGGSLPGPDQCPRHPEAGFTRVKGDSRLWCAEPGCSASFEEKA